jgi:5'-nucleotidase
MAVFGGLLVLTLGAGCASKKAVPDASTSNLAVSDAPRASALEVAAAPVSTQAVSTPAEAPPSPAPAYEPPGPTPTPDPVITQAPTLVGGPGIAVGGPYTVQHGDTLFRIAKEHYGDGKQWKRIASANPGLTPANLKAGQSIMLP